MEEKDKKPTIKCKKFNETTEQKPKSKTRKYWDEYLNGVQGKILDMRAVLK